MDHLIKKIDAEVIEETADFVLLRVDAEPEHEPEPEPVEQTHVDVLVRIVKLLFMVNGTLGLCIATGYMPYQFLVLDERRTVSMVLCITGASVGLLLYAGMLVLVRLRYMWPATLLFSLWAMNAYVVAVALAASLRNLAPLQMAMIVALQSFGVLVYAAWNRAHIDAWRALYLMLGLGFIGWALGIYAYVVEWDWISAVVLLFASIGSALYCAMQIPRVSRYRLDRDDMIRAVVEFYGEPAVYISERVCGPP
jgi:hypothetical protein